MTIGSDLNRAVGRDTFAMSDGVYVAQVDIHERQLTLKLVYYGPPLSGKTTNLRWIHQLVDGRNRGRLMTLDTRDDRTLFFDLLPIFFRTSKLAIRLKVYTVPGQPMHETTRQLVLRGADGIAFIADAQRSQTRANNDAYQNMLRNMNEVGLVQTRVPVVIQYNKCDLPDVLSESESRAFGELPDGREESVYRSVAIHGTGVVDTFLGLVEQTWIAADRHIKLEGPFGIGCRDFLAALREHIA